MNMKVEDQDLTQTKSLDRVGIFLSALCVIHCIATPFLIFLSPWIASFFDSKWSHLGIFLFILPVAYFTFYRFYKYHRNKQPIILGSIGVIFLAIALLSPGHGWEIDHGDIHNHNTHHFNYLDTVINIAGSVILISAHWLNIKIHRNTKTADECCHHH